MYGRPRSGPATDTAHASREQSILQAGPQRCRCEVGVKGDGDSVVIFQEIAGTKIKAGNRFTRAADRPCLPAPQKNTGTNREPAKLIFDQAASINRPTKRLRLPPSRALAACAPMRPTGRLLTRHHRARAPTSWPGDAASAGSVSDGLAARTSTAPDCWRDAG